MDRVRDQVNSWLVPMYDDLKNKTAYFTYDKEDIEALAAMYQAQLTAKSERFTNLWNSMQCTLDEAREGQGLDKLPGGKGNIFKIAGTVALVPADKIDEYAEDSVSSPEPPMPPQLPAPNTTTVQEIPQDGNAPSTDNTEKQRRTIARSRKTLVAANYKVWHCASGACEFCLENDGVIVAIDEPFPNGVNEPGDCHKFCKCEATVLAVPDESDIAKLSIAALIAAYTVERIASRHDADVAAQQAADDNEKSRRHRYSHDRSPHQKPLALFATDERYLRLRSLSIPSQTYAQKRHNGLLAPRTIQHPTP